MLNLRFVTPLIMLTLSTFHSTVAYADWSLNKEASQVNFISIKNEHVAESHTFDSFSGTLDKSGKLDISIDLTSVNTAISIRNERMQSMLFNVARYTTATFVAQVDPSLLNMPAGKSSIVDVSGQLTISGKTVDTSFMVLVTALADNKVQATTVKPALLKADDFGLSAGVDALQKVANLDSISKTVPLTFSIIFE